MATTFAEQLQQFALAVDRIDEETFVDISRLVRDYLQDVLAIRSTKILIEPTAGDGFGLEHRWLGETTGHVLPYRDGKRPRGQSGLAYLRGKPLWIVSRDGKQRLDQCSEYRDLWSRRGRLSAYVTPVLPDGSVVAATRTSIILPMRGGSRVLGVISLESDEYVEATDVAKRELLRIADAVATLIRRKRENAATRDASAEALAGLRATVVGKRLPRLTKPKIFLASSHAARPDVIDSVQRVLAGYSDRLQKSYWKDMERPGNINQQLLEELETCRYAICYLSEDRERLSQEGRLGSPPPPATAPPEAANHCRNSYPDGHRYQDNPNVVFEAGMFHGRVDDLYQTPRSWLPIREGDSAELPFDFAHDRRIEVPRRRRDGALIAGRFEKELRASIDAMLKGP